MPTCALFLSLRLFTEYAIIVFAGGTGGPDLSPPSPQVSEGLATPISVSVDSPTIPSFGHAVASDFRRQPTVSGGAAPTGFATHVPFGHISSPLCVQPLATLSPLGTTIAGASDAASEVAVGAGSGLELVAVSKDSSLPPAQVLKDVSVASGDTPVGISSGCVAPSVDADMHVSNVIIPGGVSTDAVFDSLDTVVVDTPAPKESQVDVTTGASSEAPIVEGDAVPNPGVAVQVEIPQDAANSSEGHLAGTPSIQPMLAKSPQVAASPTSSSVCECSFTHSSSWVFFAVHTLTYFVLCSSAL